MFDHRQNAALPVTLDHRDAQSSRLLLIRSEGPNGIARIDRAFLIDIKHRGERDRDTPAHTGLRVLLAETPRKIDIAPLADGLRARRILHPHRVVRSPLVLHRDQRQVPKAVADTGGLFNLLHQREGLRARTQVHVPQHHASGPQGAQHRFRPVRQPLTVHRHEQMPRRPIPAGRSLVGCGNCRRKNGRFRSLAGRLRERLRMIRRVEGSLGPVGRRRGGHRVRGRRARGREHGVPERKSDGRAEEAARHQHKGPRGGGCVGVHGRGGIPLIRRVG